MSGRLRGLALCKTLPGLYAGLPAFFVRCVALVGAQMTTYDWAKANLLEKGLFANGVGCHVASSAVAAGAAVRRCSSLFFVARCERCLPHSHPPVAALSLLHVSWTLATGCA